MLCSPSGTCSSSKVGPSPAFPSVLILVDCGSWINSSVPGSVGVFGVSMSGVELPSVSSSEKLDSGKSEYDFLHWTDLLRHFSHQLVNLD
jgi:hypothetical protein